MKILPLFASAILALPTLANAELSASLEQELALDSNEHKQKFETLFTPEWSIELSDNLSMTMIGRVRWDNTKRLHDTEGSHFGAPDSYGSGNGPIFQSDSSEISLREWYIDTNFWGIDWRLGKQQVVWGQADGLKILDVVNPQSFREFILDDFDDSRIPLWMANMEVPLGEDSALQLLWIPDLSYHEFAVADSEYTATSPLFRPQLPQGISLISFDEDKPSSPIKDSDIGLQFSTFYQGWDLTLNYLYHYQDSPVLYQHFNTQGISIHSNYERNHLAGVTASNAFGSFTLRTEIGYNSDTFHLSQDLSRSGIHRTPELASVLGLDWQGLENTMISIQWFQSHLIKHNSRVIRPQNNHIASLLIRRSFANEAWELEVLALHGFDQDDGAVQTKLQYMLESNVSLWIGSDTFYGKRDGLFGQFHQKDRIVLGSEWGF